MSYYRDSPSHYSRRSPPRIEQQIIEDQINLKNALRSESENRRLLDEISLLQIKLRKTEELEAKVQGLIKQNSHLAQDNDTLARELSERRYELERLRSNTVQLQERDTIKTTQLSQINRSLELEIELLKKQRLESNKLYESHIQKLEFMLEDKIKELDILSIRCNDLINEKEVNQIRFEEEKNRLKNLLARNSHDLQRQIEYTKEKTSTQKYVQVETLKKNYTSQILLLQDEISKLKSANDYKNSEFENQLVDNKNLRTRYEQDLRALENENEDLRVKIQKLQEVNMTEVVSIETKYKDLQRRDTSELSTTFNKEINTLIADIDKLNWLLREKNQEIQNLIRDKKDQKIQEEERQLALRAEIDTLKNKLEVQQDKSREDGQQQNRRIQSLADKLQRDSEAYHDRVNQLNKNLNSVESQLKSKQNELDRTRNQNDIQTRELQRIIEETEDKLDRTRRELRESEKDRAAEKRQFEEFKQKTYKKIADLTKQNKQFENQIEQLGEKIQRHADTSGDQEKVLRLQIDSLKKNINVLQRGLSEEQSRHANEMAELSANIKAKLEKLQIQQKKSLAQLQESRANEIEALNRRLEKSQRDREQANRKLIQYVKMYEDLDRHFKNPAQGSICRERGESSLYETLGKVTESVINIF